MVVQLSSWIITSPGWYVFGRLSKWVRLVIRTVLDYRVLILPATAELDLDTSRVLPIGRMSLVGLRISILKLPVKA